MRQAMVIAFAGLIAVLAGCQSQRPIQTVRESGDRAYRLQNYERANSDYAEVVDREPTDWRYRAKLGKTLLVLGRPIAAREHLAIAHERKPNEDTILEDYARAMLESEDYDTLHQTLTERARETQAGSDYVRLGRFDMYAGDADSAERALITAARLDAGQTPEPQLALATFYETVGDETQAVRRLRMALHTNLEHPEVNRRLREKGYIPGPTFALPPMELNN